MPFVEHNNASLYYQRVGQGPALTFAHGAGGNAASWFQQVPFFHERYETLCFDHRGFGRSTCTEENFNMNRFADDLVAILDDADIERTALVCQSMGGWTGIDFARRFPDRVSALVMSHTTGGITSDSIETANRAAANSRRQPTSPFGSWAIAEDLPLRDPVRANLYNQIGAFNITINLNKLLGRGIRDRPGVTAADLVDFDVPVLFVTSDLDIMIPPAAVREAAGLIRHSELVEFEGIGHSSYFELPETFNQVVDSFLSRNP